METIVQASSKGGGVGAGVGDACSNVNLMCQKVGVTSALHSFGWYGHCCLPTIMATVNGDEPTSIPPELHEPRKTSKNNFHQRIQKQLPGWALNGLQPFPFPSILH